MIVYQIRVSGGEYEDRYDFHVETHLFKFRAEERLRDLTGELNDDIARYKGYCSHCGSLEMSKCPYKEITYDDDDVALEWAYCVNEVPYYEVDNIRYYIEEIEVIE